MEYKFDVVIFGATGCVGKCVVMEAINVLQGLTWAVAGYSKCKLEKTLSHISQQTATDLRSIPILISDAMDMKSIQDLVETCKVLVNCCGPYQLWAELVIDMCIRAGTHYVDMCNDPYFNELMELRYHQKAIENNVYVLSCCGFQSFPIEMGLNYIKQNFQGTVNYVDSYVRYNYERGSFFPKCPLFSHSAWINLIWSCALVGEMPWLRDELRETALPILLPKQPRKQLFHKCDNCDNSVYLRFPFVDQLIVDRSQYNFYLKDKMRPIQFYQYVEFPSFFWALVFLTWFIVISLLAQYCMTRNFLISHPKLFSLGVCSPHCCAKCVNQRCSYNIILRAEGWSSTTENIAAASCSIVKYETLNQQLTLEISGYNPIYGCGCLCLLLSARSILEEEEKMPERGGVYSPGYAFQKINMVEKLRPYPNHISYRLL